LEDSMNEDVVAGRNYDETEDVQRTKSLLDRLVRLPESGDDDQSSLEAQLRTADKKDSGLWNDDSNLEENSARNYRGHGGVKRGDSDDESEREEMSAALRLMRMLHAR